MKTAEKDKNKRKKNNINIDEENRHTISNPIAKGESSIAMGIEATDAPLPLWFNEKKDNAKKPNKSS